MAEDPSPTHRQAKLAPPDQPQQAQMVPPRQPIINAPPIVVGLTVFLIGAAIIVWVLPTPTKLALEEAAGLTPGRFTAGMAANGGVLSWLSPLFSHMLIHAGWMHLIMNSLWLIAFGAPVARRLALGSTGFLSSVVFATFFALCGAAGGLAYVALHPNEYILLVGASGGVSGLLGALVRFAFVRHPLFSGPPPLAPLTHPTVLIWTVMIIILNIGVTLWAGSGGNIAWEAHIGGYLFGLLSYPLFERWSRLR